MYKTDLKDETFSISNTKQYELLLQLLPASFSYAVYDNQRNKFVLLRNENITNSKKSYKEEIVSFFEKDEVLQSKYINTKAILGSSKSVFVPKALFDKNKLSELLNFNSPINKNERVLFDELKNEVYNIYSFDKITLEALTANFSNIKTYNQGTVLLNNNIHKKRLNKKQIIIDTNFSFFEIIFIDNNELIFRNTFEYKAETDFVFYVLSVLDKFKINNETDEVLISGTKTTNSKEIELLRKYIKKIRFKRTESNYSYVFNDIDINIYTNLLNLQNCE